MQRLDLMAAIRNAVFELNDILDQLRASDTVELVMKKRKGETTDDEPQPHEDGPETTEDFTDGLGEPEDFEFYGL